MMKDAIKISWLLTFLLVGCPTPQTGGQSSEPDDAGGVDAQDEAEAGPGDDADPFDGFSVSDGRSGGNDTQTGGDATDDVATDTGGDDVAPDTPVCTALQYPDNDGDGFGDAAGTPVALCEVTAGYAMDATDCDDTTGAVNPEADEVCDGVDNDCNTQVDETGCPCMVESQGTQTYQFCTQLATWPQARDACAANGYHLVTLNDADEDGWVRLRSRAHGMEPPWNGFNDRGQEGNFSWEDGTPVGYTNWDNGEPNDGGGGEDCGIWRENEFQWDDRPCSSTYAYICEAP